jgi:hypothetical protein
MVTIMAGSCVGRAIVAVAAGFDPMPIIDGGHQCGQ